jgi:hypothetical protein
VLHKCANPACNNPFRKLSQGKLFLVETEPIEESNQANWRARSSHHIEYYWLCDQCALVLTLSYEKGRGVVTVSRPQQAKNRLPVAPRTAELPIRQSSLGEQAT